MPGWTLAVLKDRIDEQPNLREAKVFTLFSNVASIQTVHHKIPVVTALPRWINQFFLFCSTHRVPLLSWLLDYRNLMFFYPVLLRILSCKIKRYKPEHIMISSWAVAKNIKPISWVKTTLYLHSPMQYIRSHYDEYHEKLKWCKGKIFNRIVPKLRERDLKYTHFDKVYANSIYTAELAQKLYAMKAIVKYPRIEDAYLHTEVVEQPLPYYIFVGRLVTFVKECDVIIHLFNKLWLPLIMLGSGPDELYLKSIAKDNIVFVGWIQNIHERVKLMSEATWLINLTKESFWMGTAESLLLGVPVFGYAHGATPELVHQDCWVLVADKSLKTLESAFDLFAQTAWDRKKIAKKTRTRLYK